LSSAAPPRILIRGKFSRNAKRSPVERRFENFAKAAENARPTPKKRADQTRSRQENLKIVKKTLKLRRGPIAKSPEIFTIERRRRFANARTSVAPDFATLFYYATLFRAFLLEG
jgi:hypothetical protein